MKKIILSAMVTLTLFGTSSASWADTNCSNAFKATLPGAPGLNGREIAICDVFAANGWVDNKILYAPNFCAIADCDTNVLVATLVGLQRAGFSVNPLLDPKQLTIDLYSSNDSGQMVMYKIAQASINGN